MPAFKTSSGATTVKLTPLPASSHGKPVDTFAAAADLERDLTHAIAGEVRFDRGSRAMYASDGSNYRQIPIGLVVEETRQKLDQAQDLRDTDRGYGKDQSRRLREPSDDRELHQQAARQGGGDPGYHRDHIRDVVNDEELRGQRGRDRSERALREVDDAVGPIDQHEADGQKRAEGSDDQALEILTVGNRGRFGQAGEYDLACEDDDDETRNESAGTAERAAIRQQCCSPPPGQKARESFPESLREQS